MMGKPPTNALVAVAWLKTIAGLPAGKVATSLPREPADWPDGFVQATIISRAPDIDTPRRRPLVQVDVWVQPHGTGSVKPPFGEANHLAELVYAATDSRTQDFGVTLTMPAGYDSARVLSAYPTTEVTTVPDDPSGYARATLDLALDWARV